MNMRTDDIESLIRTMQPALNPGCYAFATPVNDRPIDLESVIAFIREPEGTSVVLSEDLALEQGLQIYFRAAWITLTVNSDLKAIGLTAAFATALGRANISCNVIAGCYHDHIFVPIELADLAMRTLRQLQESATS